jgi:hypothetical protein
VKQRLVAAIVGALLGIAGCSQGVRTYEPWQTTPVQSARPQTRDTFPVEATLRSGSPLTVEFGVSGAQLNEGGTSAPALLFELPPLEGAHVLTLLSRQRVGDSGPGAVYPRVRMLDAQRVPVREVRSAQLIDRIGLQATIFVNPTQRHERYVLITADAVPADRLLRLQPPSTPPNTLLASFDRGVLVLDFRPEPAEYVPFP